MHFRVSHTGGQGINLRREPSTTAERVTAVAEGTVLDGEEHAWRRVRDETGAEGWVADAFLAREAGRYRVAGTGGQGANLRREPGADTERVKVLAEGAALTGEEHAWRRVADAAGGRGWAADLFLEPEGAEDAAHRLSGELSDEADRRFGFVALWPHIRAASEKHGADPEVVAGIMAQESGFANWRVHRDGTGHGLFGLDDNGLLPDFERWCGLACGRGAAAISIPPKLQIEYCARTIAALTREHGDPYIAARVWHRGPSLWRDERGEQYERLIRGHVEALRGGRLAETFG
jgi:SH3-like domain-containing protein